ncbi:MAG TPA: bifunctional phosphopantothenoylcysteine decarboxylase/phosphopantothenate--cysteine ligase CoaBC [Flavisolibacter sp.]|nr:bifunctional phosphopantothenoylcysteine decarboxylase/phosphopantothenate--cysteine ligase CoaBC [Flavisolibacter sp.]
MLKGKKIVIGITGSIAAYKIPLLVRLLIKEGAEVKIIMTAASADFVSKLTLATLSGNPVLVDLFEGDTWANHVQLGRWADIFLIAPLSCNTLSKMAYGQCDNLLLATYLSATCPVVVAPAMDDDMWHHPATKENLQKIAHHHCLIIDVGYGALASGLTGMGRMAEPEEIFIKLKELLTKKESLNGKKALVTAGPTYESIDPVRFIGNHSSGKMGFAIAEELAERGADVVLVSGPVGLEPKNKRIKQVKVTNAEEMYNASMIDLGSYDIMVMAAAVADYTPVTASTEKIKKNEAGISIALKSTKDILLSLGQVKKDRQVLVGFALETSNEKENALKKLNSKNVDMLVLNSLKDKNAGFGFDTNKVTIFFKNGREMTSELKSKTELAKDIVDALTELL